MLRDRTDGCFQTLSINLAVNCHPAVKSSHADVLQQVQDFRKRPPLAVLPQVGSRMSFEDLASAFVSGVRVFIITHLQYTKSRYNAKMRLLQSVTVKYVASVAQLVEQLTLNQLVWGSSPHRGTISYAFFTRTGGCGIKSFCFFASDKEWWGESPFAPPPMSDHCRWLPKVVLPPRVSVFG